MRCDEDVTINSNKQYKHDYIALLIKLNEEQYKNQKEKTAIYFSDSKNLKSLKRRIQNIRKKKNRITLSTKIIVLIGLISTIGSATAIAKEMDRPINAIFSNHVSFLDKDKYEMIDEEENFEIEEEFNFIKFDDHIFDQNSEITFFKRPYAAYEIILEDGTRQEYRNDAEINTKHTHSFKNINIKEHTKYKDGSCTIITYAGKKCTACQYVVYYSEIISENIYNPCKH